MKPNLQKMIEDGFKKHTNITDFIDPRLNGVIDVYLKGDEYIMYFKDNDEICGRYKIKKDG